jgi:hypothetical protein
MLSNIDLFFNFIKSLINIKDITDHDPDPLFRIYQDLGGQLIMDAPDPQH